MLNNLLTSLITYALALMSVAFFTLLERKALGYFQMRKGPNKVSITGLPQPLADAIKLFTKQWLTPIQSNTLPFLMTPSMMLILALSLWQLFPAQSMTNYSSLGMLLFLCISSMTAYTTLMAGWSSNSKYSLLGAIRAMAQTVSYEIAMTLVILLFLNISSTMDIISISLQNKVIPNTALFLPLILMWLTIILAETNRTPFDFAEGESELVSGFNIEYGGAGFALLFMAEYSNILFMSILTSTIFMSSIMMSIPVAFMFLWARATLPRYRYDLLMNTAWKSFLPLTLITPMLGAILILLI
uniref:NADH-ubiquinone oxidoreductase chain 1 n=1 Tax=Mutela dubia TaxID=152234 RepID=A0A1Y9T614_9BIVA|nr:NADH dehydrogenase subunit 1 [Mutela dubia]AQT38518.1 NADH dehydrogenase subunit 1 [Mutela dubia]